MFRSSRCTSLDTKTSRFRVQWHRFEPGCDLHPLIQTVPHIAFKVLDLDEVLKGKRVIQAPFCPFEGFRVAFIEDGGAPIELIQTSLSEREVIARAKEHST